MSKHSDKTLLPFPRRMRRVSTFLLLALIFSMQGALRAQEEDSQAIVVSNESPQLFSAIVELEKLQEIQIDEVDLSLLLNGEYHLFFGVRQVKGQCKMSIQKQGATESYKTIGIDNVFIGSDQIVYTFDSSNEFIDDIILGGGKMFIQLENIDIHEASDDDNSDIKPMVCEMEFEIQISQFYNIKARSGQETSTIFTSPNINDLPFQIVLPHGLQQDKQRLEVEVEQILDSGISGSQKFDKMTGFFNLETNTIPNESSYLSTFVQYSASTSAVIINEKMAESCYMGTRCVMNFNVEAEHVQKIVIRSQIKESVTSLKIDQETYDTILSSRTSLTYVISEDSPKEIDVSILPVEGDVVVYANLGSPVPNDRSRAMMKVTSKGNKRLLITQELLMKVQMTKLLVFVTVESDIRSRFTIKATEVFDKVHSLPTGVIEVGEIFGDEQAVYQLKMQTSSHLKGSHKIMTRLHIISGEADLYLKTCPLFDSVDDVNDDQEQVDDCNLTEMELQNPEKYSKNVRIASQKNAIKTIEVDLQDHLDIDMNKIVKIFVVGKKSKDSKSSSSTTDMGIHYQLSVEDLNSIHTLSHGHHLRVRIHKKEVKAYKYIFLESTEQWKGLALKLEAHFGKVEVCVRKGEAHKLEEESAPAHFDHSNCIYNVQLDGNQYGAANNLISQYLGSDKGIYMVYVKGDSSSAELSISIQEESESGTGSMYHSNGNIVARTLKAGVAVSGRFEHLSISQKLYSFKIKKSKGIDMITVSLLAKRGNFYLAVRNDDRLPTISQQYWVSTDNTLTISRDDPRFKEDAEYIVAVLPTESNRDEINDAITKQNMDELIFTPWDSEYSIKFTYNDKHDLLSPGIPEMGILSQDSSQKCFIAEILEEYQDITLSKNIGGMDITFYASIGPSNYKPDFKKHQYSVKEGKVALYVKNPTKKCKNSKECHLYFCIYGLPNRRYSVTFLPNLGDKSPMMAVEGSPITVPEFWQEGEYRYIYHPNPSKDLEIEQSALVHFPTLEIKCSSSNKKSAKKSLSWKFTSSNSYKMTTDVSTFFISKNILKKFSQPICQVKARFGQFIGPTRQRSLGSSPLNLSTPFHMTFVQSIKELAHDEEIVQHVLAGTTRYFLFYNDDPMRSVLVQTIPLGDAGLEVFIDKGRSTRPSQRHCLNLAAFQVDNIIQVDFDSVKANGYKNMMGFFVVGVFSPKDTEFRISWQSELSDIIMPTFGLPVTLQAPMDGEAIVKIVLPQLADFKNRTVILDVANNGSSFDIYSKVGTKKSLKNMDTGSSFPSGSDNQKSESFSFYDKFRSIEIPLNNDADTTKNSHSKNSKNAFIFITIKQKTQLDLELLFRVEDQPVKIFYGKTYHGMYIKKEKEQPTLRLAGSRNQKNRLMIIESKSQLTIQVDGDTIKPLNTGTSTSEVALPNPNTTGPTSAGSGAWGSNDIKIISAYGRDEEYTLTVLSGTDAMRMIINQPRSRIFWKKTPKFEALKPTAGEKQVFIFNHDALSKREELFMEIKIKNHYFSLKKNYDRYIRRHILSCFTMEYAEDRKKLETQPLKYYKDELYFSQQALTMPLHNKEGVYRFTIDWQKLDWLFSFPQYVDGLVYSITFSNKDTTEMDTPSFRVAGNGYKSSPITFSIASQLEQRQFMSLKFFPCFGDYDVDIDFMQWDKTDKRADSVVDNGGGASTNVASTSRGGDRERLQSVSLQETSEPALRTFRYPIKRALVTLTPKKSQQREMNLDTNNVGDSWLAIAVESNSFSHPIYGSPFSKGSIQSLVLDSNLLRVEFSPIVITDARFTGTNYTTETTYHVIIARNERIVRYRQACGYTHMNEFYKELGYSGESDPRGAIVSNVEVTKDETTGNMFFQTKTPAGENQFLGIFAITSIFEKKGTDNTVYRGQMKTMYDMKEFETSVFTLEVEVLGTSFFFLGIMVLSFVLIMSVSLRYVKATQSGFLVIAQENEEDDIEAQFNKMREMFGREFVDELEEELEEEQREKIRQVKKESTVRLDLDA